MTIEDIALTMTPGIGVKGAVHLLDVFTQARAVFQASETELTERAELRPDLARQIVRCTGFAAAERELVYCARHGIQVLASTDPLYPPLLREIPDYPHVLYVMGEAAVLSRDCVSMVGTREVTPYGLNMCSHLVQGLAERLPHLCVVSGLAYGVDVACHRAALAAQAKTVAVLPCSLPEVVPVQHAGVAHDVLASGGALVSELSSQAKQRGTFYLARNRLIAGLSEGTVVVESPCGGGSLVTARYADGYGRTVMAVPGRAVDASSRGTNLLIRNRTAQLVLSAQDVVEELSWQAKLPEAEAHPEPTVAELTAAERGVLASMPSSDPLPTAELALRTGLDAGALSVALLGLEMAGAIRQLPGNRYVKTR